MPVLPTFSSLSNTVMQWPLWVTFCTTILHISVDSVYNLSAYAIKSSIVAISFTVHDQTRFNDFFSFTNENAEKSSKIWPKIQRDCPVARFAKSCFMIREFSKEKIGAPAVQNRALSVVLNSRSGTVRGAELTEATYWGWNAPLFSFLSALNLVALSQTMLFCLLWRREHLQCR